MVARFVTPVRDLPEQTLRPLPASVRWSVTDAPSAPGSPRLACAYSTVRPGDGAMGGWSLSGGGEGRWHPRTTAGPRYPGYNLISA
jgi:hypothetical protein